ncbi:MAG: ATP synthase F1 subunit epsilon [Candidatus Merdousia sp.]|nr:ATP synthase F1 subunit epsilon [Candidatus Merdousia sp.]
MALALEIITPDGIVWRNDSVESITLPTTSGEIQILAGHIPLITMLEAGGVGAVINGREEDIAIDRGYARIMGDTVSVLTEAAVDVEHLDIGDIEKARAQALKAVEDAKKNRVVDDEEMERLEAVARFAIAQMLAKAKHK